MLEALISFQVPTSSGATRSLTFEVIMISVVHFDSASGYRLAQLPAKRAICNSIGETQFKRDNYGEWIRRQGRTGYGRDVRNWTRDRGAVCEIRCKSCRGGAASIRT